MATTQLFVELLITGVGALIWLLFILAAVFNLHYSPEWINIKPLHIPPLIILIYVLGISIDRLCYSIFSGLNRQNIAHYIDRDINSKLKNEYNSIGNIYVLCAMINRIFHRIFSKNDKENEASVNGSAKNGKFEGVYKRCKETRENYEKWIIYCETILDDLEDYILESSKTLGSKIYYNQNRLAICRSWTVNFFMIAITFFIWNLRIDFISTLHALFLSLLLMALAVLSFFAWNSFSKDNCKNILQSYHSLKSMKLTK